MRFSEYDFIYTRFWLSLCLSVASLIELGGGNVLPINHVALET